MTIGQRISWVVLPAGRYGDLLRVSVLVLPRLRSDTVRPVLAEFPDLLDWTARVLDPGFGLGLGFADGSTVPVTVDLSRVEPGLWSTMFGPEVPVASYVFDDHADRPLITYSRRELASFLRHTWTQTLADSPADLPPTTTTPHKEPVANGLDRRLTGILDNRLLSGLRGEQADLDLDARLLSLLAVARRTADLRRSGAVPRGGPALEPLPADGSIGQHFARAVAFHRRAATRQDFPDGAVAEQALRGSVDLHQMLSALGDHPVLLRRLGLLLDATVDAAALPEADPGAPGRLRVEPSWTSLSVTGTSTDVRPWTSYVTGRLGDLAVFSAALRTPGTGPVAAHLGLLPLPDAAFGLDQVDVDGAVLKTLNTAVTVTHAATRAPGDVPVAEPDSSGLPALRTGGVALVHTGRADALQASFTRSLDLETALAGSADGAGVVLTKEDLTRGYRLDVVTDTSPTSQSVQERLVSYSIRGRAGDPIRSADEGHFSASAAAPAVPPGAPPDPGSELYVGETLITWDGWSLAAPRPGRAVNRDPRAPDPDVPESQLQRPTNTAVTALGLEIATRARPGTLPRLRFGSTYSVRVRTVDLAGHGPSSGEADALVADHGAEPAFTATTLTATEPYLRFEPVPAPVLVPRVAFQEGASAQRLVIRSDAGLTPDQWATAFADSAAAAAGHPAYLPVDERHLVPPKAAVELIERHRVLDGVIGGVTNPPTPEQQAQIDAVHTWLVRERRTLADPDSGDVTLVPLDGTGQTYAVHAEDQLEVPYLADPQACGVVLFDLPGSTEPMVIRFGEPVGPASPGPASVRLTLVDGGQPPAYDATTRVLTVAVPQAATATIRVASLLDQPDLMGLLAWCDRELTGPARDGVVEAAKANRCWAITPWHELRLVHAVQRPLVAPGIGRFHVPDRSVGQTRVPLEGALGFDLDSTEQVDVVATWSEWVDDPVTPRPVRRDGRTVVFSLPIRTAATGSGPDREWPYWIEGDRILFFDTRLTAGRQLPLPLGHEFGDTKHRQVDYAVVATSAFREYFPPAWADDATRFTRSTTSADVAALAVPVPASARPAPPHVLYAVPTVAWSEQASADGTGVVRTRHGNGMRIYLDRPWFSSGDGELLGVVIGSYLQVPQEATTPYVTLFGRDPARASGQVESASVEAFRDPVTVGQRIPLVETSRPGLAEDLVSVVGYPVTFDEETARWFCDITMDIGTSVGAAPEPAYLPFVRLALVRFQPAAVDTQLISTVAAVDLVQTLPDRALTVVRPANSPGTATVRLGGVAGRGYHSATASTTDPAALTRATAWVERRSDRVADPVLGWVTAADPPTVLGWAGAASGWTGTVAVPPDPAGLRLVVQEEEFLPAEAGGGLDGARSRIVYVDTIMLTPS